MVIRLTPVYAAVLGFVATLWTRIGSGPDWTYVQYVSEACREKWWIHMLYLNNYVIHSSSMIVMTFLGLRKESTPSNELLSLQCLPESWYVATDFQMFVFSPLFIYPLWRWRRTGLLWAILSLAALIGANILAHWAWDLPATVMHSRPYVNNSVHSRTNDLIFTLNQSGHWREACLIISLIGIGKLIFVSRLTFLESSWDTHCTRRKDPT